MTAGARKNKRGSTMLEFVLVGIPVIFIILSIVEISRGMWAYHTLAYAVREGVRYSVMHGKDCASPNTCQVTIGQIAGVIEGAAAGLDPNAVTLTFTPASGSASTGTMANQAASATTWPPSTANADGQSVKISAVYPFHTFLAIFWAGAHSVADSGTFYLPASSTEQIQF